MTGWRARLVAPKVKRNYSSVLIYRPMAGYLASRQTFPKYICSQMAGVLED